MIHIVISEYLEVIRAYSGCLIFIQRILKAFNGNDCDYETLNIYIVNYMCGAFKFVVFNLEIIQNNCSIWMQFNGILSSNNMVVQNPKALKQHKELLPELSITIA